MDTIRDLPEFAQIADSLSPADCIPLGIQLGIAASGLEGMASDATADTATTFLYILQRWANTQPKDTNVRYLLHQKLHKAGLYVQADMVMPGGAAQEIGYNDTVTSDGQKTRISSNQYNLGETMKSVIKCHKDGFSECIRLLLKPITNVAERLHVKTKIMKALFEQMELFESCSGTTAVYDTSIAYQLGDIHKTFQAIRLAMIKQKSESSTFVDYISSVLSRVSNEEARDDIKLQLIAMINQGTRTPPTYSPPHYYNTQTQTQTYHKHEVRSTDALASYTLSLLEVHQANSLIATEYRYARQMKLRHQMVDHLQASFECEREPELVPCAFGEKSDGRHSDVCSRSSSSDTIFLALWTQRCQSARRIIMKMYDILDSTLQKQTELVYRSSDAEFFSGEENQDRCDPKMATRRNATDEEKVDGLACASRIIKPTQLPQEEAHNILVESRGKLLETSPLRDESLDWLLLHNASRKGKLAIVRYLVGRCDVNKSTSKGVTALHEAAGNNHVDIVQVLVNNGAIIDQGDIDDWTPLHYACQKGHLEVVTCLSKQADLSKSTSDGHTALHIAAENDNVNVVKELIAGGISVDQGDNEKHTSLHLASQAGTLEVVKCLTGNGAVIDLSDAQGHIALHFACLKGHLAVVQYLCSRVDVNKATINGETALHLAASKNQLDIVKYLCQNGAVIDQEDNEGITPLHDACQEGHLAIVEYLCRRSDVNKAKHGGETALHLAVGKNQPHIVEYLSENGAIIDQEDKKGWTPLHVACYEGHLAMMDYLYSPANVRKATEHGLTALHLAAKRNKNHIVKFLIQNGAVIDQENNEGLTPLHYACKEGHLSVVEYLSRQVDVNKAASNGTTALHLAAYNNQLDIVKFLSQNGAVINKEDNEGLIPIHDACQEGHLAVVKYLCSRMNVNKANINGETAPHVAAGKNQSHKSVTHEAVINQGDNWGLTPLHYACKNGHLAVVKYLCSRVDVNKATAAGSTALHIAAYNYQLDIVKCLCQNGALIDREKNEGLTPLHDACQEGHLAIVEYLCSRSDVNKAKTNGKTALHLAAGKNQPHIVKYLSENGAIIDQEDKKGMTPLHDACQEGHRAVVEYLCSRVNVNKASSKGTTALIIAAFNNRLDIVKCLIGNGAIIDQEDKNGWTPLHCACEEGHLAVVEFLSGQVDKNKATTDGETALHLAAYNNQLDIVKYLCQNGAVIDQEDNEGLIPLHYACQKGHLAVVEYLSRQVGINKATAEGATALHIAAYNNHLDTVEYLCQNGAVMDEEDNDGLIPLHYACQEGHLVIVEYLCKRTDINKATAGGTTAVHIATCNNHLDIVKYLSQNGGVIDQEDNEGFTPLHDACQDGHLEIVQFFCSRLDINKATFEGATALIIAACNNRLDIVKCLIDHGAVIDQEDRKGWTPLHYACEEGHLAVVEYLSRQVGINKATADGDTALH